MSGPKRPNLKDLEKSLNGDYLFNGTLKELKAFIEYKSHHYQADLKEFNRNLEHQASFSLQQAMESDQQRLKLADASELISEFKHHVAWMEGAKQKAEKDQQQLESDMQRLKLDDARKLISDLKVEYKFKKASADYKYEQDKAMVVYKYIHELHHRKKREGEPPHLSQLSLEDRAWVMEMAQKVFVPYPKY